MNTINVNSINDASKSYQFIDNGEITKREQRVIEKRFWHSFKGSLVEEDTILHKNDSEQQLAMRASYFKKKPDITKSSNVSSDILIEKFSICMTKTNMSCLQDGNLINDDVLNFYFSLLQETKVHYKYFNTFFMNQLMMDLSTYNFDNVKR